MMRSSITLFSKAEIQAILGVIYFSIKRMIAIASRNRYQTSGKVTLNGHNMDKGKEYVLGDFGGRGKTPGKIL
jgi:hypothetical protein